MSKFLIVYGYIVLQILEFYVNKCKVNGINEGVIYVVGNVVFLLKLNIVKLIFVVLVFFWRDYCFCSNVKKFY